MPPDNSDYHPLRGAPLGRAHFRALSFCFDVDWNAVGFEGPVRRALGPLEVSGGRCGSRCPPPERVPTYHLAAVSGDGAKQFAVFLDRELLHQSDSRASLIDYFFWRVNGHVVDSARDFFLIHAGAVATGAGAGILLPGESGAGKSSLVLALVRAGFSYLSDEFAPIDPVHRRLHSYPKSVTLKSGSFPLFSNDVAACRASCEPAPGQVHVRPSDVGGTLRLEPVDVRYVVVPEYRPGASLSLVPMSRAAALVTLATCSLGLGFYGARGLSLLRDVVAGSACVRLRYSALDDAVAAVAELAGPPSAV